MSKWSNIYRQQIAKAESLEEYVTARTRYKRRLIKMIGRHVRGSGIILETGCGTGASLVALHNLGFAVAGIDSDPDMIKLAKEVNAAASDKVCLMEGDIFNIPVDLVDIDLIFSNGVLEHFNDDKIIKIIKHSLSRSDLMIFSVPTDYFSADQKIFGNERFLSFNYWKKIVDDSEAECIETFGFGFKSALVEIIYNVSCGFWPRKAPFIGFVLKRNLSQ